ncbi:MAG: GAF domain-containing protein [Muribaculaceae bacterium]|nr:GAF domain-containing protein [Muribaculaceae bacterium]
MNSHNWTTVIGLLASVLTIIQVIVYLVALPKDTPPQQLWPIILYQSAVVLCVIGLCILLTNAQIKNTKLQEQNKSINKQKEHTEDTFNHKNAIISLLAKTHHSTSHEIRQMLYSFCLFDLDNSDEELEGEQGSIPENNSEQTNTTDIVKTDEELWDYAIGQKLHENTAKLQKFMTFFMSNVKNIFDTITQDDCSVHISLFCDDDSSSVFTLFRDPASETERTNVDLKYPKYRVDLFTPYKHIMSRRTIDPIFICNDCSKYDNYCDRNDNWKNFYNACISVPIRVRVDKENDVHNQIGFLTVDNNKGFSDYEQVAINQLRAFADSLYMVFETYLIHWAMVSRKD